ncbi:MAG: DUF5110 domain-containing protein [Candidatus Omnitrophica bacterium]|nr:DUF5110 domain-containing protein [Candidatus Omnitrophota bacterium]
MAPVKFRVVNGKNGLCRITVTKEPEKKSGLERYGFLEKNWARLRLEDSPRLRIIRKGNRFLVKDVAGRRLISGQVERLGAEGYKFIFPLAREEVLYGLGDIGRNQIDRKGMKGEMWIRNVTQYIPIPFLMSPQGYGLFVNTTFRHTWDIGHTDPEKLQIFLPHGPADIFIFFGRELKSILSGYTALTGRPCLPPLWSFGLWFICRTQANDFEVISDAVKFREREIPCDIIGLEPGWMEKEYDYSVEKRWHPVRFPFPSYAPNGPHTFLSALKRLGYKVELWLCNDYDLSSQAEKNCHSDRDKSDFFSEDEAEKDHHFTAPVVMDKLTKPDQPWFDHLKKFVDQGVDFFKQDGALQVCEHPDRLWANGMRDIEMHNLYPLVYSQQMYQGFKEYTGRRPCCFTPAGWAGLQRYTGTWTGDTGGGPKTLVACLNLALSGHGLVTCDMETTTKEGIHYGFLLPWAQVNSWNYFRHPWLLGDQLYPIFCDYARLRSQLVPYIYTYAYQAHLTGVPILRPLPLEFPKMPEIAKCLNSFFLGRELLVTAFSQEIYLPPGRWVDFWTGETYSGPLSFTYQPPVNRGGGLFLRENSILPLGPISQYVGQSLEEKYTIYISLNPESQAEFRLYQDDGTTFDYQKGKYSIRHFQASFTKKEGHLEIPDIQTEKIYLMLPEKPHRILINGQPANYHWDKENLLATLLG